MFELTTPLAALKHPFKWAAMTENERQHECERLAQLSLAKLRNREIEAEIARDKTTKRKYQFKEPRTVLVLGDENAGRDLVARCGLRRQIGASSSPFQDRQNNRKMIMETLATTLRHWASQAVEHIETAIITDEIRDIVAMYEGCYFIDSDEVELLEYASLIKSVVQHPRMQRYLPKVISPVSQYLIANVERILSSNYVPTQDDLIKGLDFTNKEIFDYAVVHNNRSLLHIWEYLHDLEYFKPRYRPAWFKLLDLTCFVVFVCKATNYDVYLDGAETNLLEQQMRWLKSMMSNPFFARANVIVMLNEEGFDTKLLHSSFKKHFPQFKGNHTSVRQTRKFIWDRFEACKRPTWESRAVDTPILINFNSAHAHEQERVFDMLRLAVDSVCNEIDCECLKLTYKYPTNPGLYVTGSCASFDSI